MHIHTVSINFYYTFHMKKTLILLAIGLMANAGAEQITVTGPQTSDNQAGYTGFNFTLTNMDWLTPSVPPLRIRFFWKALILLPSIRGIAIPLWELPFMKRTEIPGAL
jgi:hypothetical protein